MGDLQWISIGKLAKATGFAVERIRMWEQRYGAPTSHRLASGHRRYNIEEVERLHLVREALARGKRPRHVVAMKREALLQLLGALTLAGPSSLNRSSKGDLSPAPWALNDWLAAAGRMDDAFLDRQFYEQWLGLGSLNFLVERVQPFARALSGCRQRGEIGAAEERFGSEKLGDFLSTVWRRLNENNTESPVLLSTLPDDPQSLGSQVAAVVMALAGLRVIYLGPAAALDDLISAAQRQKVQGVLLSVALDRDPVLTAKHLAYLRVGLPPEAFLAVSGVLAAPAGPEIQCFSELPGLFQWARKWAPGHSARGFR